MVAGALERRAEDRGLERQGLRRWLRAAVEAQSGRSFLWSPVVIALGVWLYFGLSAEPSLLVTAVIAVTALLLAFFGRKTPVVGLASLLAAGFVLGKLRAEMTATPLLRATTAEVAVAGRIAKVDRPSPGRLTIILETASIEGFTTERTPRRLRLSASAKAGIPKVGTAVSFKARLSPLPTPVQPGGFDYGRKLWFESVGGTGRIIGPVNVLDGAIHWTAEIEATLTGVRAAMGARIHAVLDEPYASFAEALITGERSTIAKEINQSLLVSGLFHILSISGLHMWMVVGGVFWAVRAALALIPPLALRWPIKKWAAAVALAMGLFYMLLADSGVATERSFIMIAVVFFAVLVDRPALSARNLAIAALIILVTEPEAAIEASFQMSFLAVLGLVSFYEVWSGLSRRRDGEQLVQRHWLHRMAARLLIAGAASILTTLIAGTLSSIPAVYHFGRLAPYGLVANGLALPVIAIVVMPCALIGAILMPFGLEGPPLFVMGEGLRLLLLISDWVAGFPGAHVVAPQPAAENVMILALGATLLCLLAGYLRLVGLVLMMAGLALMATPVRGPDLLVERSGQNAAFRNAEGLLVPALPKRARFTVEKWLQANGEEVAPAAAAQRPGWTCRDSRCDGEVKGKRVAFVSKAEGKALDCSGLDILIADFPLRGACKAVSLRIDRFDLWRSGAHAVMIVNDGVVVETARQTQGQRPWVVRPEARKTPYKPAPATGESE